MAPIQPPSVYSSKSKLPKRSHLFLFLEILQQKVCEFILHIIDTTLLDSKDWLSVYRTDLILVKGKVLGCCNAEQLEVIARQERS